MFESRNLFSMQAYVSFRVLFSRKYNVGLVLFIIDSFSESLGGNNFNSEPEFVENIKNVTVPSGREAILSCVVSNLGKYKVSSLSRSPTPTYVCCGSLEVYQVTVSSNLPTSTARRPKKSARTTSSYKCSAIFNENTFAFTFHGQAWFLQETCDFQLSTNVTKSKTAENLYYIFILSGFNYKRTHIFTIFNSV